jgi:hypothetical protein
MLPDTDWITLNDFSNVEEAIGYFCHTVYSVFNDAKKKKNFHTNHKYPCWFPKEIISSLKLKEYHRKHME